ncbi:Unknown protein [Striga hermonthica]|uniref:Uncharacterized protein n=1 Tax=Striga hermonthica TaxID=68872 RepID=A0A9N7R912_STRHE|nr:Unknown protein [Striga hermonthica]
MFGCPCGAYISQWLNEYWMSGREIRSFASEADAFVQDMARARPESSGIVPVAVNFQVRTVQAEGVAERTVMKTAICRPSAGGGWCLSTCGTGRLFTKPLDEHVRQFLFDLPRTRIKRMKGGVSCLCAAYAWIDRTWGHR